MKACAVLVVAFLSLAFCGSRVFLEGEGPFSAVDWIKGAALSPEDTIKLTFALKQKNINQLENYVTIASNPKSALYGKHLSAEEVGMITAPHTETVLAVERWLTSSGVTEYSFSKHKEWVYATLPVKTAQALLGEGLKFHQYTHKTAPYTFIRSLDAGYSVPSELVEHLDFIGGIFRLPKVQKMRVSAVNPEQSGYVTPATIKTAFGVGSTVGRNSSNLQGVAQFLGQYLSPSDLANFQRTFNVPVQPVTRLIGPNQASNPGIEAMLDIEYIMGIANNVPTWFEYTPGEHQSQEPFLTWINNVLTRAVTPYVHTVSYGDTESTVTLSYATRINSELLKIAATGRTVIFASGDNGVGCNNAGTKQEPNFPATSPWVTSVGGVVLNSASPLSVVSDYISSGGFSNYFGRPSYQDAAVKKYLSGSNLPPASSYNASGRGFPDVASISENVIIVVDGGETAVGGTSCAAPVFGAIISLVNDLRISQGKATLGFLNRALYTLDYANGALVDVTSGSSNDDADCQGFKPSAGWDPITGWGVPNYPGLAKHFAALP